MLHQQIELNVGIERIILAPGWTNSNAVPLPHTAIPAKTNQPMNMAEIYFRPLRSPRPYRSSREQHFVEALLVAIFGQWPAEPGRDRFL
jgi:hypothetical protein